MSDVREPTQAEIDAKVAVQRALVLKLEAEAREAAAAASEAELHRDKFAIDVAREQEKRQRELAEDTYHHVYRFGDSVTAGTAKSCVDKLMQWSRIDPKCDMEIVFCSPGGSIIDGMYLYDAIIDLRDAGHKVTTVAMGWAASMAGILLQAGDPREMGRQAYVLIHEAAFAAMGKVGEVEDTLELVHKMGDRVLDIFAERAKATGRPAAMSRAQIARHWRRKDWWLTADECYKYGFVDKIR